MTPMKCHAIYKRKRFWCGSVSATDGTIQEVHSLGVAMRCDFSGDFFFSDEEWEKMESGESVFFCIREDGKIDGNCEDLPEWIAARIREQIRLLWY